MTRSASAAAIALLLAITACSAGDQASPASRASPGSSASPPVGPVSPAPSATTTPAPKPSAGPSKPAAKSPLAGSPAPRPPLANDQERPGDRVRGVRTLVGDVEPGELCPLLRVGSQRWALVGATAQRLKAGERVEVTGTVVATPRGCPAAKALKVTRVRQR